MVLKSFADTDTEKVWLREPVGKWDRNLRRSALKKLNLLNMAAKLDDLRVPPGNRLETLRGNRAGQHSIRINRQWRICFKWSSDGPEQIEITDYH